MNKIETFASKVALIDDASQAIAQCLKEGITQYGEASLALSGGGTPGPVYEKLSTDDSIDWAKVKVTLADERRSPPEDEKDNALLVRRALLKNAAADASFTPLDGPHALNAFPKRINCVVFGMGGDGHFASIFPHSSGSEEALTTTARVVGVTPDPMPKDAPYKRWTLSLDTLTNIDLGLLLITGEQKKDVLEQAMQEGPVMDLPIRALLRHPTVPLRILWAA